jgi:hypothetical protein
MFDKVLQIPKILVTHWYAVAGIAVMDFALSYLYSMLPGAKNNLIGNIAFGAVRKSVAMIVWESKNIFM